MIEWIGIGLFTTSYIMPAVAFGPLGSEMSGWFCAKTVFSDIFTHSLSLMFAAPSLLVPLYVLLRLKRTSPALQAALSLIVVALIFAMFIAFQMHDQLRAMVRMIGYYAWNMGMFLTVLPELSKWNAPSKTPATSVAGNINE